MSYRPSASTTREAFVELESHLRMTPAQSEPRLLNPRLMFSSAKQLVLDDARAVVDFWQEAGPSMWFAKDAAFDAQFRERFIVSHEAAAQDKLIYWLATPIGALALVLLLDQFPRNAFRGTPRMYATDPKAREIASAAIDAGFYCEVPEGLRMFFLLPFGHSERIEDQRRSVTLAQPLGEPVLTHAKGHHDIIERFGRFPHRNPILGRSMTEEEQRFLDEGGYAG